MNDRRGETVTGIIGPMSRRVGVLSARPRSDGRSLLILWDGRTQLLDPGLPDEAITADFALDQLVHAPDVDFVPAIHLDGPLAGTTGYAINRLGYQADFALPPRPGGPTGTYELVKLSEHDEPAELRLLDFQAHGRRRPEPA
jgi:hypothetical protein